MNNQNTKIELISGEEFLKISAFIRPIIDRGKSDNTPLLVILTGGVGSGKTTIRNKNYANNFIHFEFGEIYTLLKHTFGEANDKLMTYTSLACDLILQEAIKDKRNIVTEVIGDKKGILEHIMDGMINQGYKISVEYIYCEQAEAYKRHLKLVEEDKDYLSVYFTQEATMAFFLKTLNLK